MWVKVRVADTRSVRQRHKDECPEYVQHLAEIRSKFRHAGFIPGTRVAVMELAFLVEVERKETRFPVT